MQTEMLITFTRMLTARGWKYTQDCILIKLLIYKWHSWHLSRARLQLQITHPLSSSLEAGTRGRLWRMKLCHTDIFVKWKSWKTMPQVSISSRRHKSGFVNKISLLVSSSIEETFFVLQERFCTHQGDNFDELCIIFKNVETSFFLVIGEK